MGLFGILAVSLFMVFLVLTASYLLFVVVEPEDKTIYQEIDFNNNIKINIGPDGNCQVYSEKFLRQNIRSIVQNCRNLEIIIS